MPFTDHPCGGGPSELEGGEEGDCLASGYKEGVATMLSLGCERGSSSSKRRVELDGGWDSELKASTGGDSLASGESISPPIHFLGWCLGVGQSDPHL